MPTSILPTLLRNSCSRIVLVNYSRTTLATWVLLTFHANPLLSKNTKFGTEGVGEGRGLSSPIIDSEDIRKDIILIQLHEAVVWIRQYLSWAWLRSPSLFYFMHVLYHWEKFDIFTPWQFIFAASCCPCQAFKYLQNSADHKSHHVSSKKFLIHSSSNSGHINNLNVGILLFSWQIFPACSVSGLVSSNLTITNYWILVTERRH
jgi:hypothetical protein